MNGLIHSLSVNSIREMCFTGFSRSPSKGYRRTVGAVSREAILEENRYIDGYRQMSKSQTFSGNSNAPNSSDNPTSTCANAGNDGFSRHDGVNSQVRATLPQDRSVRPWKDGDQSDKSEE